MPEYWKQKVIFINVKLPVGYDFFILFFLINFQDPVVWIKKGDFVFSNLFYKSYCSKYVCHI